MKDLMPDMQATERTTLIGYLDFERAAILTQTDGLSSGQLHAVVPGTTMSLAALLKHLWHVEDTWFVSRFLGMPLTEVWADAPVDPDPSWAYRSAADNDPLWLREQYRRTCAAHNELIEVISIEAVAATFRGNNRWTLRWMLLHLIEETARHLGHAELIRQWVDGSEG